MKSYWWNCKNDTKSINPRVLKRSNNRTIILSKCPKSGSKKSTFIKNQEAKWLLRYLGFRTPLSKVPISGNILVLIRWKAMYKMNKFLLAGDKFLPEIHLKQPVFTYSACGSFTKNKERT